MQNMDLEKKADRLCEKLLHPNGDTLARQVRDGLISKQEAEQIIREVYRAFLKNCQRKIPSAQAEGLEELGIRVPVLVLEMI